MGNEKEISNLKCLVRAKETDYQQLLKEYVKITEERNIFEKKYNNLWFKHYGKKRNLETSVFGYDWVKCPYCQKKWQLIKSLEKGQRIKKKCGYCGGLFWLNGKECEE